MNVNNRVCFTQYFIQDFHDRLRVFNGEEEEIAVFNNLRGGGQVQIDMRSQPVGAYYVEYQFDDQVIVETVLKTE